MTDGLFKKIVEHLALDYKDAIKNHKLSQVEAMKRECSGLSVYIADYDKVVDITNEEYSDYCYLAQPMMYDAYEAAQSELNLRNIIEREVEKRFCSSLNDYYFKELIDYKDLALGDKNVYYTSEDRSTKND